MTKLAATGQDTARETGRIIGHALAVICGLILIILGAGMGVSLVLLPLGVPLGLIGVAVALWGAFGWEEEKPASR